MQNYSRALNKFYTAHSALWNIDDSWEGFQWLNVDDAERSALAFLRTSRSKRRVVCVCNFTPVRYDDFLIGLPKAGVLREALSSDDVTFGGSGQHNPPEIRSDKLPFNGMEYSAKVMLPPMSCVYFTYTSK